MVVTAKPAKPAAINAISQPSSSATLPAAFQGQVVRAIPRDMTDPDHRFHAIGVWTRRATEL
jgi:hypothetical protein